MPDPAPPVPAEYGAIKPGAVTGGGTTAERWAWGRRQPPPNDARRARRSAEPATARRRPDPATARRGAEPATARRGAASRRVANNTQPDIPAVSADRRPAPEAGDRRARQDHAVGVARYDHSRRLVRHIDTLTVFKVSLMFYLFILVVVVIAGVLLWNIAAAFGFLNSIEKSVKTLFDYTAFTLHPGPVLEYTVAGGAALALVGTLANVLAALLYNLIADVVGGVQVVVMADEE